MTRDPISVAMTEDEQPLQLDAQGIPILLDAVISGEQLAATGIALPPASTGPASERHLNPDLEQRIQEAIDAALPKVTERTAAAMRQALFQEVQDRLHQTDTK